MKRLYRPAILSFLAAVLLVPGCGNRSRETVPPESPAKNVAQLSGEMEVMVPCGVAGPYGAIQEIFEERYPDVKIKLDVANVDVQRRLVVNGKAKPDVWISLGDREIMAAAEKGLLDGEPVTYAYNSVGMIVGRKNPCGIQDVRDLLKPSVKTVAIPTDNNSSGYYMKQALQKAGVWEEIEREKLWLTDQPAMVKKQLQDGNAEAGVVYYPCTRETSKVGGKQRHVSSKVLVLGKVPTTLSGQIPAQAAVVKGASNPEAGRAFLQLLLEDQVQDIWEEWAFDRAVEPASGKRTTLLLYCGAGIRPFMDSAVAEYKKLRPEVRIDPSYAGSGCLLSQLTFAQRGDLYMPGEDFYLNQARSKGFISEDTLIGYFEPVLIVQKGNPKNIEGLDDLTRKGIKLGIGEPEACAVGRAAEAVLKNAGLLKKVQPNIAIRAGNVPELGNQVKLKALDVAIVWNVTAAQVADSCDEIALPEDLYEPSPIPLGVLKFAESEAEARKFIEFCASEKGQELVEAAGMSRASAGESEVDASA